MFKLTVKAIEAAKLPAGTSERLLSDGENLVLRVRPTGKAWLFRYRYDGARDKLYLGEYPAVGLATARALAAGHRETLAAGKNPKAELERTKHEQKAAALAAASGEVPTTVRQLAERWRDDYLKRKHVDGGAYAMGIFERHLFPEGVGELPLDLLRARQIKAVLDRTYAKGVTRTCGVLLANLRQMFKFATGHDWIAGDPSSPFNASDWEGAASEGDRVLSEDELVELFSKLPESLGPRWQKALKLILAASTRVEETTLAERSHVNFERGEWRIPVANQKRTRKKSKPADHVIYLSDFAKTQLLELLEMPDATQFVFPAKARTSANKEPRPANEKTLSHAVHDRQTAERQSGRAKNTKALLLQRGPWTVHDLRRTSGTLMGELGVAPHIIERCLNHEIAGAVERTYNRAKMRDDMTNAWNLIGARLQQLEARGLALYRQRLAEKATEGLI